MRDPSRTREVIFDIDAAILCGPTPLGQVEIPLRPGLTSLYGLNGAGKSRTLQALEALFLNDSRDGFFKLAVEPSPALTDRISVLQASDADLVAALPPAEAPWRGRNPLAEKLGDSWSLTGCGVLLKVHQTLRC